MSKAFETRLDEALDAGAVVGAVGAVGAVNKDLADSLLSILGNSSPSCGGYPGGFRKVGPNTVEAWADAEPADESMDTGPYSVTFQVLSLQPIIRIRLISGGSGDREYNSPEKLVDSLSEIVYDQA